MDRLASIATFVKAMDAGPFMAAAVLGRSPQMVAKHVTHLASGQLVRVLPDHETPSRPMLGCMERPAASACISG